MLLVSKGFKMALIGPRGFDDIFNGGQLRLFAGGRPADASFAEPSAPIAIVTTAGPDGPGLQFVLNEEFALKSPNDVWKLYAQATGVASWWRLVAAADTFADSMTAARIDGDVGVTSAPKDMTLVTNSFTLGDTITFDTFLYTFPPLAA